VKLVRWIGFLFVLTVGGLIFVKSLNYYQPDFSRGYLAGKRPFFDGIFQYGLYAHIAATPLLLLWGSLQFFFRYEYRRGAWHRWLGRGYAVLVLGLAAPGGLIMARHAIGGTWGQVNFYLLWMLWLLTTGLGWSPARRRHWHRHRRWMQRSYLLALSAILLRLWAFVFAYYLEWRSPEAYVWAAWLSWVPSLVIYEVVRLGRQWRATKKGAGAP